MNRLHKLQRRFMNATLVPAHPGAARRLLQASQHTKPVLRQPCALPSLTQASAKCGGVEDGTIRHPSIFVDYLGFFSTLIVELDDHTSYSVVAPPSRLSL